jgi:dTDP-4-amino-4,6-dideoxygalactose transaminase
LGLHNAPILIPANTCYIVLWAVLQSGNLPVLADVDLDSASVTPDTLTATGITPAAIIPAHMYGLPAPMQALTAWARARGVWVIEDAALALGSVVAGRPAGAWGDVAVFSFGRGKGADMDNGGAALTHDSARADAIEAEIRVLPLWSEALARLNRQWLDIYWALHQHEDANPALPALYRPLFQMYGPMTQYRLRDAAWRDLPSALAAFDAETLHRKRLAQLYDDGLQNTPAQTFPRPNDTVLWRYPLRVPASQRDGLMQALWSAGITDVTRWYPSLQPMLRELAPDAPTTATPNADRLSAEIVNLPLSAETSEADAEQIMSLIQSYFAAL